MIPCTATVTYATTQEFFNAQFQSELDKSSDLQELEDLGSKDDSAAASTNGTPQPTSTGTRIRLVSSSAKEAANGDKVDG